jgi:serine/threonine protein kinase
VTDTTDLRAQLHRSLGTGYTLDRELGDGSMSRVFVAHGTALGRNVVIKVLSPELSAYETMPQDGGVGGGPHSNTSWVNMIGVPAVVVPVRFYASGLPFGLEFSS